MQINPMKAAGVFCSRLRAAENAVVALGHSFYGSRIVKSLCFHTGHELFMREPRTCQRTARTWDGSSLKVTLEEPSWRETYFSGVQEPEVTSVIKNLVRPGQVWLDIGANIGYFTMTLARGVGPSGKVFAFEPNPQVSSLLEESILLNAFSNVELVRAAVANKPGELELHIPLLEKDSHTAITGRASLLRHRDVEHSVSKKVPVITLDDFLSQHRIDKVDYLKIDIEGAELFAFQGLVNTLKTKPLKGIVTELTTYPDSAATPLELIEYLCGFGYRPFRIRKGGLVEYRLGEVIDAEQDKDMLFLKSEVEEKLA